MDPLSAGIGAAGSILGGIFGKKKEKYVVPDYAGIRSKAEAAGFNPLTALTQGPQGQVVQTGGYMGSAIADAAMIAADAMAKDKEKTENEALKQQNAELRKKVQAQTLRPKVAGIYAQREAVPSRRQSVSSASSLPQDYVNGPVPLVDRAPDSGAVQPTISESVDSALGSIAVPEPTLDRGSPFLVAGELWESPPGWTSPAQFEDEVAGDNPLLTIPYASAWSGALIGHNLVHPYLRRRDWERMRARRKSDDLDHMVTKLGSKPRTRTTDWERKHKSRWLFN